MITTIIEGYNLIVYGSVVPLLLRDASLGVDAEATGLIGGVIYIGAIIGAISAAIAAEKIGKKHVLVIGVAVFALAAVLAGLAQSGTILGLARFLAGVGTGAALTTAMTVARNHATNKNASLVVTITMAGIPLGGVVASLIGIPVLPAFGWRAMFFIGAALTAAILVAILATRIGEENAQEVAGRGWSVQDKIRSLFTGRGLLVTLVIAVCAVANMVAWQGLNVWATEAMVSLGFSLTSALLFAFTLTGAAVLGSMVSAVAADRWGSAVATLGTAACTVIGLVGIIMTPPSTATTLIFIALMGIGGHSTMNLVHSTTANIYPLPVRATALGWSNGTSFIGAFFGPVAGATAFAAGGATGLFSAFSIAAVVCLAAVTGLYLADRRLTHSSFFTPRTAPASALETDTAPAV
ncbi:MFS transporter [Arthrobacter sp. HMWF013]|nr:MFS transporter [Arthrobacter sp. HMWF013]